MNQKEFIKSRVGTYTWDPDSDFFKSVNNYIKENGELLDKEVYPSENSEVFTYKVKTPNGKPFIAYLNVNKDLGYDPDPTFDIKVGKDLFDSIPLAYGPGRTMDKVRKEWDAVKNGTAGEEYYQSYCKVNTYSWVKLISKIGIPLLTSVLGSAASKAKFELTKDKDVFDETLRKFKKAKNADDVKKYYDMLQSQLNKAQNKDEVKDDLKEAKKEAETKAYSKTKTYSNEFKSIEDGRVGIFKNAVLKNKDGSELLEVDLGNGFTAQAWWEPEFLDFDWQLNDNNKQDSDSFETLYELETEIKNRGLATYSLDPIKSELISYLETSIPYDKNTLEEIKEAIKSADKSELIKMLDEEIANNDTPNDVEKFKSIRTKLSTNSKSSDQWRAIASELTYNQPRFQLIQMQ